MYKLEAEVYSYSRSKGLFAGLSINGSNISVDKSANANFYGPKVLHTLFLPMVQVTQRKWVI
jgi:lipid-binding SYLF domain-containing protein